jgi:hypothetical protein
MTSAQDWERRAAALLPGARSGGRQRQPKFRQEQAITILVYAAGVTGVTARLMAAGLRRSSAPRSSREQAGRSGQLALTELTRATPAAIPFLWVLPTVTTHYLRSRRAAVCRRLQPIRDAPP